MSCTQLTYLGVNRGYTMWTLTNDQQSLQHDKQCHQPSSVAPEDRVLSHDFRDCFTWTGGIPSIHKITPQLVKIEIISNNKPIYKIYHPSLHIASPTSLQHYLLSLFDHTLPCTTHMSMLASHAHATRLQNRRCHNFVEVTPLNHAYEWLLSWNPIGFALQKKTMSNVLDQNVPDSPWRTSGGALKDEPQGVFLVLPSYSKQKLIHHR